jgi:hypothetical protein
MVQHIETWIFVELILRRSTTPLRKEDKSITPGSFSQLLSFNYQLLHKLPSHFCEVTKFTHKLLLHFISVNFCSLIYATYDSSVAG